MSWGMRVFLAGVTARAVGAPDLAVTMCRTSLSLGRRANLGRSRAYPQRSDLDPILSLPDRPQGGFAATDASRAEAVRLKLAKADYLVLLARAWISLGNEDGALGSARRAVRLEPDDSSPGAVPRRLE
jgi:Flp pilus assembly protein TadD